MSKDILIPNDRDHIEERRAKIHRMDAETLLLRENTKARRRMPSFARKLLRFWITLVVLVLFMHAYRDYTGFTISDQVLIVFLVSSTSLIIGIPAIVLKGLFLTQEKK